jgi:hypothetical protein
MEHTSSPTLSGKKFCNNCAQKAKPLACFREVSNLILNHECDYSWFSSDPPGKTWVNVLSYSTTTPFDMAWNSFFTAIQSFDAIVTHIAVK